MPLWGKVDNSANSPNWAIQQFGLGHTAANTANLYGNTTANVIVNRQTVGLFAVDTAEMAAGSGLGNSFPTHSGWVLRTVGQGGRAGRVTYETLVATGSITGDGEDTIFKDYRLVIDTQPQSSAQLRGNSVNFTVVAHSIPAGATLRYYWQQNGGNVAQTWANVANAGVFASANGNTTSTLSVSNNFTVTGNNFRVFVSTDGAPLLPSANATLSYT